MKTIVKPRSYIDSLWGKQKASDQAVYRLMEYVLRVDYNNEVLLQNLVSGQLVTLDKEENNVIDQLPQSYSSIMDQLIQAHYLVPVDFDEYKSVKQLRRILQIRPQDTAINHYVILPTTFCNARCFYCYESDYPRVQMSEETARQVIDFIAEHRGGKDVGINWFGGEPLVGIDRIDQICQGLKDQNIPFTSSMISNGYLFDETVIARSVELWKLHRVQITLDGTEETYNRVKAYVNNKDNPFERVLRNIDLLSDLKVHVNIRLNIDFYNKDDIRELIELLGERYSENNNVTVYLNMLFNNQGFEPVTHSYEEMLELSDLIDMYTERLKELHLSFDSGNYLYLSISQCMADNPHSLMIQPDGSFCRCEHENILDRYGDLKNGIIDLDRLNKWKEAREPSEECPHCVLYPACYHLKNCMNSDLPCIQKFQQKNITKQKDRILALYVHNKEVKVDENI